MRLGLACCLIGLSLVGLCTAQESHASIRRDTNIPAEPLDQALRTLAKERQFQVLYRAELVRDVRTEGAVGEFTPEEALNHLLSGTGLSYKYLDASTVTIVPVAMVTAGATTDQTQTNPNSTQEPPKEAGKKSSQGFRVAQVDQTPPGPQVESATSEGSKKPKQEALSEVVVTGTYLHDTAPITPVTTITQADLVNQGYTTLADAIFDLPENFMGAGTSPASNPVNGAGGSNASANSTYASGINLRGLGGNATLVLLNGRRMAPTADGYTVDISQIPVSVIDRVEIMTDGASSLYGSDAVAGVVNIITKKDFSGIEVGGRSTGITPGKTPNYGGDLTGGTSWSTGGLVASFDYEKDNPLFARNRSFSDTVPNPWALTPQNESEHYFVSIHQDITNRLTLSVDGLAAHRAFEATNNLTAGALSYVSNGYAKQYNLSPQLDFAISSDWTASLIGQWSREQDLTNDTYPPPLTSLSSLYPVTYQVSYVEPRIDGKLFDLPGGGVRLAVGGQARQEKLDYAQIGVDVSNLSRHVTSAYAELMIPIIGAENALPFTRELRIDVSSRYDHYSDFGSSTNPKIGISWAPIDSLKLHGSYSRSFQAPTLWDESTVNNVAYVIPYANPQSPTGSSAALDTQIAAPLQPETAKSYNFGLTLEPMSGLKIDASYFDINFTNEITELRGEFCVTFSCSLQDQAALGSFFQRNPSLAEVNSILNNPTLPFIFNALNGFCVLGTAGCPAINPSTITAIATLGNVNAASTRVRGVDLTPRYIGIETPMGRFNADLDASYYFTYRQQITAGSVPYSPDNTVFNPLRFRAKANVGWQWRGWGANARVNFANSYINTSDPSCAGGCPISSWTTFDTGLSYKFSNDSPAGLRGLRFAVTVTNLFDRKPPYVSFPVGAGNLGYDPVNANPLMRTVAVTFTKRFGGDLQ